jgi:HK97 family phage major capsid protein
MGEISQQLEGLSDQQGRILKEMEDQNEILKAKDERYDEAKARIDTLAAEMAKITAERTAKERDAEVERQGQILADLAARINQRAESKAGVIGQGSAGTVGSTPDDFYWSLWASKSTKFPELNAEGKARLEAMGSVWSDVPAYSKATLGDTAGAGGNIVPPNVLASVVELAKIINPYRELMTWTDAGFVTGVDVPTEQSPIARATVQAYGATKTNLNLTVGKYSATMYTLAAIYDVGNQFLRNSRGAAETLVRDRLTRAMAFGEAYYLLNGSGTSEPKGLLTSIGTSGGFVTAFTASSTTLAGSSAAAVAKATGALANRFRQADGVVCNASDFWIMAAQGTDTAGFFLAPAAGPAAIDPTRGLIRIWGLPVYADPNMPTDSMVVGEWRSATVYTGQSYRVDVSDVAGTRWDTNETGFRGEEELAFNADPYVASGIFQRVTDFTP